MILGVLIYLAGVVTGAISLMLLLWLVEEAYHKGQRDQQEYERTLLVRTLRTSKKT